MPMPNALVATATPTPAPAHEFVLRLLALFVGHPAVIGDAGDALLGEMRGDFLDVLARRAVDDAGLELPDELRDALQLGGLALRRRDAEREIVARKAGDKHAGRLAAEFAEAELFDDVVAHFGRGRGGQGDDLRLAEIFERPFQPQIIGTEIVSPLRDAMRLVHRKQRDGQRRQRLDKPFALEPFGRDIDKPKLALSSAPMPLVDFGLAQARN